MLRKRNQAKEYAALKQWRAQNPDRFKTSLKKYYSTHRDQICAQQRERYAADPLYRAKHRAGNRQYLYGIDSEEYTSLCAAQNKRCAICQIDPKTLVVDHIHDETRRIRGLLCRNCNSALGLFKESPEILCSALEYIRRAQISRA